MNNFWNTLSKPFFALAPMEDVTDIVFRQVIARAAAPEVFFTEFTNTSGFIHPTGHGAVARRLQLSEKEKNVVAQIWGSKPEDFKKTVSEISDMGFAGIDINMGCPDKAVIKSGGGSALIDSPKLAEEIIKASRNDKLALSVKTRLGSNNINNWQEWIEFLLEQNLAALTIHLRSRKEMSKVAAHYELIPEIIELKKQIAPQTKLIINGDILNREQGEVLAEKYPGIDGIMIGRGVFANPFCFEKNPKNHQPTELIDLLKYHLDLFDNYNKEKYEPLKKFFKIYINNFPGAAEIRTKLMMTKNTNEARAIIDASKIF